MISLDEPLVDSNGNVIYNEDFLSATSIQSQDPNGYILRSSLDGLVEDYRESLRIYNEQLEDRQFGRNGWFRNVLEDFQSTIVGAAVDLVPGGDIAEWIIDKNLNLGADTGDVENLVKNGSKALIGTGYTFFSNQLFGENVNPVRPSRPVATFSEMRFSGDITATNSSTLAGFWTPGSDYPGNDFTPHNYPSYNEVLGMYATLKTPDIESYETIESTTTVDNTVVDVSDNITPGFPCFVNVTGTTTETTITKTKSINQEIFFKLGALPEYALNEVLDFDFNETKVYVSFSMVLENGNPLPSYQMNPSFLGLLDPLTVEEDENTNLWLKHDIPQDQGFYTKDIKRQITLNSGWYDIENAANLLLGASLNNSISFREEYEEFEALCGDDSSDETVPQILDEVLHFEPVRIEMKIMADMYFDQLSFSGETINTTQVFSYLILDEENNIDLIADNNNYVSFSNEDDFLLMFPGTLTIQSSVISGTSPEAYPSEESFVIKVRAEDIIIDQSVEGIIAAPGIGPLVKMEAHESIHLKPGARVKRNINLRINKDIYGLGVANPATDQEIESFCSSTGSYQANTLQARSNDTVDQKDALRIDQIFKEELVKTIKVYPNPAEESFFLQTTNCNYSIVSIYDLSGRVLKQEILSDQTRQYQMDLSGIAPGTYIIRVDCDEETFTEKLIVTR
jgi:hypothetical protein